MTSGLSTFAATLLTIPQQGQSTQGAAPAGAGAAPQGGPVSPGTTAQPGGTLDQSGGPVGPPPSGAEQCYTQLPFMLLLIGVFYFLLIRPQQKQEKQRRALIASLKKGDSVVTNSGMHGVIAKIDEMTVTLRVDQDVHLTFDRASIQRGVSAGGEAAVATTGGKS